MASNPDRAPFLRSQSADNQNVQNNQRLLLMTHISTFPSFQRRTVESARQLRDNISNVIREIQPLVETAGVASFSILNNRPQSEPNVSRANDTNGSFVINFDDVSVTASVSASADIDASHPPNATNPNSQATNVLNAPGNNNNPNNNVEDHADREPTSIEVHQFFQVILRYVPLVLILLLKAAYDYHEGIFIIVVLLTMFAHSNATVRKEATKRHRRSVPILALELLYISACFAFTHFVFKGESQNVNILLHLVFISTFKHPLTIGYLLWVLAVTDFVLKIITVTLKIFITMLPGAVIQFQKRGKIYLFIEAVSQLYRSAATIQPWLYYLLESYHGAEKIAAVFLSAFYMISKGSDLMSKVKLFKTASFKLLQNVTVGSSPSKEEIQTAGEHCPICHDEYDSPVLLPCRHIFCESCVTTWFDREQTCPLCRAKIVDDPSWRDGSTTYFLQIF